jgi:galactokinase
VSRGPSFRDLFGAQPAVRAEAPGRVNLMGDHTDYNGGFVLPATIPQHTIVEAARRHGTQVRVWSDQFPDAIAEYELGRAVRRGIWTDYVQGMTIELEPFGLTGGFDARIASTVPPGSGLSSSASLEIAVGRAVRELFSLAVDDLELAKAGQRAENLFVGAPVGIMDQMACSLGEEASALFLDTRSLEFDRVAIPRGVALVVIHSGITHRHADGGYITRRRECQQAAEALGVESLRDVPTPAADAVARLPSPLDRRVRHVLSENRRVRETVTAFRAGDVVEAGRLFLESHASLRDDFEVSVPEVDRLVELATLVQGTYGARLTGGGFGGSIVALADASRARKAAIAIADAYEKETRTSARVMLPE